MAARVRATEPPSQSFHGRCGVRPESRSVPDKTKPPLLGGSHAHKKPPLARRQGAMARKTKVGPGCPLGLNGCGCSPRACSVRRLVEQDGCRAKTAVRL